MSKNTQDGRWRPYEQTEFDLEARRYPPIEVANARSKQERKEMRSLKRRRSAQEREPAVKTPSPKPNETWQKILSDDKAKRIADRLKKFGY